MREHVQHLMTEHAGVLRTQAGLAEGGAALARLDDRTTQAPDVAAWETTNLHAVGSALVAAATARRETRGSHWREDFPDREDDVWRGHLDVRLVEGRLQLERAPVGQTDAGRTVLEQVDIEQADVQQLAEPAALLGAVR
jgi:succinate dehydrogenase/fumarate reductase flavoprotein subunit